jgi:hypothetical protein
MSKSCRRYPNVMTNTALQKTVLSRESAELRDKCAQFYFGTAYDANSVGDSKTDAPPDILKNSKVIVPTRSDPGSKTGF